VVIVNAGSVQSSTTIISLFNSAKITHLNNKMYIREMRPSTGKLIISFEKNFFLFPELLSF
jgi:hypothetical protein